MENETHVAINSAADIVTARQKGRTLAMELGFDGSDLTLIATAISEVARNIVDHAKTRRNYSRLHQSRQQARHSDHRPGRRPRHQGRGQGHAIWLFHQKGLGVGLPGAKWLMDEFDIETKAGKGTTVTMKKWLR